MADTTAPTNMSRKRLQVRLQLQTIRLATEDNVLEVRPLPDLSQRILAFYPPSHVIPMLPHPLLGAQ
jgi:hypothetical protein